MHKNLTKFEKARLIGTRATQISNGAEPKVDVTELYDPIEIAKREFEEKKMPIILVRKYPNREEKINLYE